MTSPLYPAFQHRCDDAINSVLRNQIEPWAMFRSSKSLEVTAFDGRAIAFSGVQFMGSPRTVLWSRYVEPFLEGVAVELIASAVREARERDVDGRQILREVEGFLVAGCHRVFARMAEIDQRLLRSELPMDVPLRSVRREVEGMRDFIGAHVAAEFAMWKRHHTIEAWYKRNQFIVWAIGLTISIIALVTAFLQ